MYGDKMFKEYLKIKNISVYKLAEMSNVPYTTLNELINGKKKINDCKIKTIESISKTLNMSIETLLQLLNNDKKTLSNSWDENKTRKFYFPIVVNNSNYECNRIHPLMQSKVNDLYNYIKTLNSVSKVIVFGSSVNIRCNKQSDIDIAVELKADHFTKEEQNKISEQIQIITSYNADVVWLNTLDQNTKLYNNICMKGVVIYE